jgi:hypothetical protein
VEATADKTAKYTYRSMPDEAFGVVWVDFSRITRINYVYDLGKHSLPAIAPGVGWVVLAMHFLGRAFQRSAQPSSFTKVQADTSPENNGGCN